MPYDTVDLTFRKIVAYFVSTEGDRIEGNGHGTHVTGAAIGKCHNSTWWEARYEGIASGAKLAFVDIGPSALNQFIVPRNITVEIYNRVKRAGSVVHFDAWGGTAKYAAFI